MGIRYDTIRYELWNVSMPESRGKKKGREEKRRKGG